MPDEDDNAQKDTIFYYSRERRLSKASARVQELYNEKNEKPTFRKVMFGNKANAMLFISIVVISILGLGINFLNREPAPRSSMRLGGNNLTITILRIDEALVLSITKNARESGEIYIGDVDIAVSPAMPIVKEGEDQDEPQIFSFRVSFRPIATETFHISLPFAGDDFFAVFNAGNEQRSMRLRVTDDESGG